MKRCERLGEGWYLASLPTHQEFEKMGIKLRHLRAGGREGSASHNSCRDSWIGLLRDGDWGYFWQSVGSGERRVVHSNDGRWAPGEPKPSDGEDNNAEGVTGFVRVDSTGKAELISSDIDSTKKCSLLCQYYD